eukprot:jgi/Tetstr1/424157/TSEL_014763.t1
MSFGVRDFLVDAGAGWASGAASVLLCQPADTILTRLQVASATPSIAAQIPGGSGAVRNPALTQASRVLMEGGTRALWRGSAPMTMVVPFQNALLFVGYGVGERWGKKMAAESDDPHASASLLPVMAGGFVGGVLQSFVVSPIELMKIRQQTLGGSLAATARSIRTSIGAPALWRGLSATLLRDGMPHGVWFASYEWSKQKMMPRTESASQDSAEAAPPMWVPLTAGAFAATVAWAVGYPFDPIKTRIQAAAAAGGRVPSVSETASDMLRETGGNPLRAFYRGFGLKLARASLCFPM